MIGAKTLATLTLLCVAAATAGALGVLHPERLMNRGWGALFVAGCFGVIVGTLMFRFWRLGERSGHGFRWATDGTLWEGEGHFLGSDWRRITIAENQGEAFDLGPRAHLAVSVAIALLLALACLDARALDLLGSFRRGLGTPTSSYCPEPGAKVTSEDPNAPGCELIRRAYALGYASTLGDCGAKQRGTSTGAPCTLRQRDEPFAHYSWRLLASFWSQLERSLGASYRQKLRHDFDARFDRIEQLRSAERQVLSSAPHASHHIWTNLPDPGDGAFREATCADRYRWLAHRPGVGTGGKAASKIFEHVLGQLLFESRYEPAAGYCREYQVHWGAPADLCQRLAASPEAVLKREGAWQSVHAALERHRLGKELEALGARAKSIEPSAFVSFQCYVEEGGTPARKSFPFALAGAPLEAAELRVPPSPPGAVVYADRYDAVARMLVQGFHYGALLSEAGLELGAADGLAASFNGGDYLLSRLYGLESFDIYLQPGWLAERPDLLEVYPYQRHLKNYVLMFRRQYHRERARL